MHKNNIHEPLSNDARRILHELRQNTVLINSANAFNHETINKLLQKNLVVIVCGSLMISQAGRQALWYAPFELNKGF